MSHSHRLRRPKIVPTVNSVDHHLQSDRQTLANRQRLLRQHTDPTTDEFAEIRSKLPTWIADERNLHAAWEHLEREGGQGAGADGVTYDAVSGQTKWEIIKAIRRSITSGDYRPGDDLHVRIPKSNGNYRTLTLQNITDRAVGRAIQQIVHPLIQPQLLSSQCGYRATGDRSELLAGVEHFAGTRGFVHTVKNDISNAFDNVPRQRLLQLLPRIIPSPPVVDLIGRVIETDASKGIRQGSPLSPLLLDIYLDHFLFRPWLQRHPEIPLLRYADDVLVLCPTAEQAFDASQALVGMIREAGFNSKYGAEVALGQLEAPASVGWLGMKLSMRDGQLMIAPDEESWQQLRERLTECHGSVSPAMAARDLMLGWFGQLGPCYDHMDHLAAYERAARIGRVVALEELPSYQDVHTAWRNAHRRWGRVRQAASGSGRACES